MVGCFESSKKIILHWLYIRMHANAIAAEMALSFFSLSGTVIGSLELVGEPVASWLDGWTGVIASFYSNEYIYLPLHCMVHNLYVLCNILYRARYLESI